MGQVKTKNLFPETIMDKIFETKSKGNIYIALREKLNFFFQELFTGIEEQEDWVIGYNSVTVSDFPDISYFPLLTREATHIYQIYS